MEWPLDLANVLTSSSAKERDIEAFPVISASEPDASFIFQPQQISFGKDNPFFEDGDVYRHMYIRDALSSYEEDIESTKVEAFGCHIAACGQVFDTLASYDHHYNAAHRHVCMTCHRSFPCGHLLEVHISEWHNVLFDVMAQRQNMYRCLVESCGEKFATTKHRKQHLIKIHSYPSDFRFDQPAKGPKPSKTTKQMQPSKQVSGVPSGCEGMDEIPVEAMDVCSGGDSEVLTPSPATRHNRVPKTICFGHGSARTFQRGKKKR